ncbi:MAG: DUF5668 domain-containing protein [Rhodopseudomonas palustris]|nr:DUF5668 domain-containing protein [Rhodopseudomonas palustris]
MSEKKQLSNGAILLGLVLIVAGALALLDNLNIFSFHFNLGDWWPLILVALGVVHLWNNRNIFDFSGLFLDPARRRLPAGRARTSSAGATSGAGGRRCSSCWASPSSSRGAPCRWPRQRRALRPASSEDSVQRQQHPGRLRADRVTSREFKGGDIANVLGGTEIDLLEAKLAARATGCSPSPPCWAASRSCVPRDWRHRGPARPPCWAASTTARGRTPTRAAAS